MAKQRMNNAAAGPSMQAPNQRNQQRPGPPPPPQQRGNKRNSTSPAEEVWLTLYGVEMFTKTPKLARNVAEK